MSEEETPITERLDVLVMATVMLAAASSKTPFTQAWYDKNTLPIGIAVSYQEGYVEGITSKGKDSILLALNTLADSFQVSLERLIQIAFDADEEFSLKANPDD